jgi:leucyl aminopeptidase
MVLFKTARVPGKEKNSVFFIPVFSDDVKKIKGLSKNAKAVVDSSRFLGEKLETLSINIPGEHRVLVGLGKRSEINSETVRRYGSICFNTAEALKREIAYASAEINSKIPSRDVVKNISEGLILSSYRFDKYVTDKKRRKRRVKTTCVVSSDFDAGKILKETMKVCEGTILARDLVNENAKDKTPEKFESIARRIASSKKIRLRVIDEKQMKKLGMELILAVNKGSSYPPRILILEYNGNPGSKERIALIGKGITFDAGGLNLKPTGYIEEMKADMGGAACVLGVIKVASDLGFKKNIISVLALTENVIGPESYKPGDVYRSYSGKTVEIKNTDAEGRLALADAISYVSKTIKPSVLIDVATLTGVMQYTFGPFVAGVLGNDDKVIKRLHETGEETHERVWQLPLYEEYEEAVKGEISDIVNTSNIKYGGGITAAAFLKRFLEKGIKWAHIDIAGTAFSDKPVHYIPKGGTGFGVRLLVEFIRK